MIVKLLLDQIESKVQAMPITLVNHSVSCKLQVTVFRRKALTFFVLINVISTLRGNPCTALFCELIFMRCMFHRENDLVYDCIYNRGLIAMLYGP